MKELFKNKKVVIGAVIALLVVGSMGGYFIYDSNRKDEIMSKMKITFTDIKEIEYGTKDFDVMKELIKEVEDCVISDDLPKIDTSKIGDVTLKFTLKKDDVVKEIEHTIKVVDTKGPEIALESDSKELTVGDEYDIKSNIKSVKDVIDGDIALVEDAKTINEKALEEYNRLKKENITDDTKIANRNLNDFFVEVTTDEEGKEITKLYLKNVYYIDGTIDVSIADKYKISVVAVDKNGIKTTKEFTITVKEKEVEKPVSSNGRSSSSGGSSSGGGSSVTRGSKQDIVNTALAQVGKTYQLNASGPNAFDCSGLIYYAYTQNGWVIPRRVSSGGTRLSSYSQLQVGDIIYMPHANHVMLYIGNDYVVEALNVEQGIRKSFIFMTGDLSDAVFIRY